MVLNIISLYYIDIKFKKKNLSSAKSNKMGHYLMSLLRDLLSFSPIAYLIAQKYMSSIFS